MVVLSAKYQPGRIQTFKLGNGNTVGLVLIFPFPIYFILTNKEA